MMMMMMMMLMMFKRLDVHQRKNMPKIAFAQTSISIFSGTQPVTHRSPLNSHVGLPRDSPAILNSPP